jgi:long-chain acyl-CoA synthetase
MSTICRKILEFPSRNGVAVKTRSQNDWKELSWREYFDQIVMLASALEKLGIKPGSKVALMSNTRLEWSIFDLAVMSLGAQIVPIYQTVTVEDLEFILNNSESETLIVENRNLYRMYSQISSSCKTVKLVLSIDPVDNSETVITSFTQLLNQGDPSFIDKFKANCEKIQPTDVATILYTSGTTGMPKGVVLTHDAAYCEVSESFPSCGVGPDDISLSFLPYAHILGRIEHWGHTYSGNCLAFAESLEKVKNNLVEIRPTFMVSVPRIFEKIYAGILTQLETNPVQKVVIKSAVKIGKTVGEYRLQRRAIPLSLALQFEVAKRIALGKVKAAFGGRLRFAISGGAPLSSEISHFFHACEVLILEGYGLTETTAAITVNTPYDYKFGSVGKAIGETRLKIAEDGEILVKSRKVMREYFKDPVSTKEVFTDGWFHTGDIGEISAGGDLKITDRKKDLIKTAGGKYVAPQRLEGLLKLNPAISNALIHGDQKKYVVALITLDKAFILKFAQEHNLEYSDYETLILNPKVTNMVRVAMSETNNSLASYESIKRYKILSQEFTVESGELTPSLKVKRKLLDKKFAAEIAELYV